MNDPYLDQQVSAFEHSPDSLEVEVPGLPATLLFAPGLKQKRALMDEGIPEGRIWTARELIGLCRLPGVTHEEVLAIAATRIAFNATIESARDIRPRR